MQSTSGRHVRQKTVPSEMMLEFYLFVATARGFAGFASFNPSWVSESQHLKHPHPRDPGYTGVVRLATSMFFKATLMYKVEADLNSPCGVTSCVSTSCKDRLGVQQRFSNVSTQGNRLQRSKTQVAGFQPPRFCFSKSGVGPEKLLPSCCVSGTTL